MLDTKLSAASNLAEVGLLSIFLHELSHKLHEFVVKCYCSDSCTNNFMLCSM